MRCHPSAFCFAVFECPQKRPGSLNAELPRFDNRESLYLGKMPLVKRGHFAAAFQSRGRHDEVGVANHPARRFQFRPNARVFVGGLFRVGNDRQ